MFMIYQDRATKGSVMRMTLRLEKNIKHCIKVFTIMFVPLIECKIPVCKVQKSSSCSYNIKPSNLQKEQEAFQAEEGARIISIMPKSILIIHIQKKKLMQGFGVYIHYVVLEQAEQQSKNLATGLMRSFVSVYNGRERLGSSANSRYQHHN